MRAALPLRLTLIFGAAACLATFSRADLPPLNNPPTDDRVPGKFVWTDLFTGNLTAASQFYTDLFGWTASPVKLPASYRKSGHGVRAYVVLYRGATPVAGIVQRPAGTQPHPARWIGYVSVPNLGAALSAVAASGGHVLAPKRIVPDRGEQAIVADGEGAIIGLIQSSTGDPADRAADPGDWNWYELFASHPSAEANFYRSVCHYDVTLDTRGPWPKHYDLRSDDRPRAGISPVPPDGTPDWLGFVRVADIDRTVANARRLGATIDAEPGQPEAGSRTAVITDPTGGTFGVVQFEPPTPVASDDGM